MEIRKLGELCDVTTGNLNKENENPFGKYDFYVRSVQKLKCDKWTIDYDAIVIPGEGSFIPQYSTGKVAIHQRVYIIKSKNTNLLKNKYLYYWWLKNSNILYKNACGSTVKSLRKNNFLSPSIFLPAIYIQQQIINIIEPFEKKLNNLIKRRDNIKKLLVNLYYEFSSNKKILFKNLIEFNITKYKNQRNYVDTSNIGYCEFISSDPIIKLKSRANLSTIKESFIFSKLDGENKIFPIWHSYFVNNFVYSTGFYNILVNDKNLSWFVLGYLLSDDFKEQKHKTSSGSVMMGINNESFNSIKISESTSSKNFNFMIKLLNLIELQIIYIKKIIENLINLYLN